MSTLPTSRRGKWRRVMFCDVVELTVLPARSPAQAPRPGGSRVVGEFGDGLPQALDTASANHDDAVLIRGSSHAIGAGLSRQLLSRVGKLRRLSPSSGKDLGARAACSGGNSARPGRRDGAQLLTRHPVAGWDLSFWGRGGGSHPGGHAARDHGSPRPGGPPQEPPSALHRISRRKTRSPNNASRIEDLRLTRLQEIFLSPSEGG